MKILFAIQGTGNGHLSRARDIYPELIKYGTVDVLVSGYQSDVQLPFPVKYKLYGLSFIFGKKGGISFAATGKRLRPVRFFKDLFSLPVKEYDLVVNDFEPISAWAAKLRRVPCISLSHQFAVLHPAAPEPMKSSFIGKLVLRHYAPVQSGYGFHFDSYEPHIFPPVIRKEVRNQIITTGDYYTVYLPAYDDNSLIRFLSRFKNTPFQVFSKHNKEPFQFEQISIQPINNESFIHSLANSKGALMGAGFEGPAEALQLQKKLMVVPMKDQYEQHCNAAALEAIGVPVVQVLSAKTLKRVHLWLENDNKVQVNFPEDTAEVAVRTLITDFKKNAAQSLKETMLHAARAAKATPPREYQN